MCLPLAICIPNHPRKIYVHEEHKNRHTLSVLEVQFTKKEEIHSPNDLYYVAWLWPSLTLCNLVHEVTMRQRNFPTLY